ncbi:MAG TPA: hypothetical protein VLJ79_07020, partial [Candidatus Binatia bacterium]|nr:hypothetical protein [Candidatus Binatia bacterium]
GRLTDDELDRIAGEKDKLIGLVQEKYGYARGDAEAEVERRFNEYREKAGGSTARMEAKAQELGATAASKANNAANVVGAKMGSLAGGIRKHAPRDGAIAKTATTVADRLESTGAYLQEKRFQDLPERFTRLVRTYPLQSLLVGFALGYLLARRPK